MSRERERFDEIGKKIKRESDVVLPPNGGGSGGGGGGFSGGVGGGGRRQVHPHLGFPGTLNTITPCAACKLLRRRCAQDCPFSPYFSPHEPHKFASVHKIFGASNVSKMLMEVAENQRADAANSLVYEANMRLRDPVYGCMGAISALQQEVQVLQSQLNAIRAEILKYKCKEANININPTSNIVPDFIASHFVSIAIQPPALPPSPPPPPPPPPLPPQLPTTSSLHDPPDMLISPSMYTQPSGTSDNYSSISNENISYFG